MPRHPPCALIGFSLDRFLDPSSNYHLYSVINDIHYRVLLFSSGSFQNPWFAAILRFRITATMSFHKIFLNSVFGFQGSKPGRFRPLLLFKRNGDGEIRTHDPLLARQVLSQLSYTPGRKSHDFLFHVPAATYSPTSSPMQYCRPGRKFSLFLTPSMHPRKKFRQPNDLFFRS